METSIDHSLKKVVKGTVVALIGSVVGLFLVFLSRVLMARYLTVSEYGIFSLSYVMLSMLAIVSLLGLSGGITRQVAFYRKRKDEARIRALIRSSIAIVVVSSLVVGSLLFILSDTISTTFFQSQDLGHCLKVFSFGLPVLTLLFLLVSVYQGFDRVDVKVYFLDLMRNLLFVLALLVVIIFGLPFDFVLYGFVLSLGLSFFGILILTLKKPPVEGLGKTAQFSDSVSKDLLFFSLPLLGSALFSLIMSWTDTLAIGFYMTSDDVGIYNAALPIASFVPVILGGMSYIYIPVVTGLWSQNRPDEIRRMYVITTKWIFSLTYPLFLVVVLFPKPVLNILFGAQYVSAAVALQILVIGFFVHTFLGLNASTLLSLGETRYLMKASIVSSIANIVLNVTLVSMFGIVGAAIATSTSLVFLNILTSSKCYVGYRIHPFTKKYLVPTLVSVPAILSVYLIVGLVVDVEHLWSLPFFFAVFLLIYFGSVLLTRGFDREDLDMIASIERRLGLDFKKVKRILKRFL